MLAQTNLMVGRPPKVLVIDDCLDAVKLISVILKHHRCETSIALDGQDALPLFENQDFDLVVLDWTMPQMSGHEMLLIVDHLLHAKRKYRKLRPMPLLVYSGHKEHELDLPDLQNFECLGVLHKGSHFKTTLRSFDFILNHLRQR